MKYLFSILLAMSSAMLLWQCGSQKELSGGRAPQGALAQEASVPAQYSASTGAGLPFDATAQTAALDKAMYAIHKGVKADYPQALSEVTALAKQGNPRALLYAGTMHKLGLGCPQSDLKALEYYIAAAELGSPIAACNAGFMLRHSDSLPPDFAQSTKWLQKAADLGYQQALYPLGDAHFKGLGTEQSYQRAVAVFEQSNDPNAMFMLAYCYLNGYGVERNVDRAKSLIKQAAMQGSKRALDFMVAIRNPEQYAEATTTLEGKLKQFATHAPEVKKRIPEKYVPVNNSPLTDGLSGTWSGALLTYDYGKTQIVNNEALTLELTLSGGELYGIWKDPKRAPLAIHATYADSVWVFADRQVRNPDPFPYQILQAMRLQYSKDADKEFLTGNLQMQLVEFNEYEQPTMWVLAKDVPAAAPVVPTVADDKMLEPQSLLRAYPNPFSTTLNVELRLVSPGKLSVALYTAGGAQVYSMPQREYAAGISVEAITAPLIPGVYLVKVEGDVHLAAWVVKR